MNVLSPIGMDPGEEGITRRGRLYLEKVNLRGNKKFCLFFVVGDVEL